MMAVSAGRYHIIFLFSNISAVIGVSTDHVIWFTGTRVNSFPSSDFCISLIHVRDTRAVSVCVPTVVNY